MAVTSQRTAEMSRMGVPDRREWGKKGERRVEEVEGETAGPDSKHFSLAVALVNGLQRQTRRTAAGRREKEE